MKALRWLTRGVVPPLLAAAVLVLLWHLEADRDTFVLPHPLDVLRQLVDHPHLYVSDAAVTLEEALAGLLIGVAVAVLLAVVMTATPVLERALMPIAVLANVTPLVAVAPALVVAFGFGITPKVVVTALMCFFPTLVSVTAGIKSADRSLIEVLRTLDASRTEILTTVQLRAAVPYAMSALRICLPLSVIGAVVAEFAAQGSTHGLGNFISVQASNSELPGVYAAVACLGLIGVALLGLSRLLERLLIARHWIEPPTTA